MTSRLADSDRWLLKPALVAAAGAVVVCVAIALNFVQSQTGDDDGGLASARQPPHSAAPRTPATEGTSPNFSGLPGFDVVRINPNGDAVVAGRAAPGATVTVRAGEQALGTVVADAHGEWVLLPDKPLPSGAHRLDLEMRIGDNAFRSKDDVLIVVPQAGQDVAGRQRGPALNPWRCGSRVTADRRLYYKNRRQGLSRPRWRSMLSSTMTRDASPSADRPQHRRAYG